MPPCYTPIGMSIHQKTDDASHPFWRHNHSIRTNKSIPFNEIRIVLDSTWRPHFGRSLGWLRNEKLETRNQQLVTP